MTTTNDSQTGEKVEPSEEERQRNINSLSKRKKEWRTFKKKKGPDMTRTQRSIGTVKHLHMQEGLKSLNFV